MGALETVLQCVFNGEEAVLPSRTPLEATLLVQYLTRQRISHDSEGKEQSALRWVLRNAVFDSTFNLKDLRRSDGNYLPALEFISCEFRNGFCADGAAINRLSFDNCTFTSEIRCNNFISLRNAKVATEVQFRRLRPSSIAKVPATDHAEDPQTASAIEQADGSPDAASPAPLQLLWIDCFAVSVGTNFILMDSHLRAPGGAECLTTGEVHYALDLSTANIACDLRLQSRVTLAGGLKMRDATVGGTVWAQGLLATDGDEESANGKPATPSGRQAFRMQNTSIGGALVLDVDESDASLVDIEQRRFRCTGEFDLRELRLKGSLFLGAAKIATRVLLNGAHIEGDFTAPTQEGNLKETFGGEQKEQTPRRLEIQGDLILSSCRIAGNCQLDLDVSSIFAEGAQLSSLALKGKCYYLNGAGIDISRNLVIWLSMLLEVRLRGARVGGELDISRTSFYPKEELRDRKRLLLLEDAEIKHQLIVSPAYAVGSRVWRWPALSFYPHAVDKVYFNLWQVPLQEDENDVNRGNRTVTLLTQGGEAIRLLDGDSKKIHSLNGTELPGGDRSPSGSVLSLTSVSAARDYLGFFCAAVWGDKGAFCIVEKDSQLPERGREELSKKLAALQKDKPDHEQEGTYRFTRFVRYSENLFEANFLVKTNGLVEMLNDTPLKLMSAPSPAEQEQAEALQVGGTELSSAPGADVTYEKTELPDYSGKPIRTGIDPDDSDYPDKLDTRHAKVRVLQTSKDFEAEVQNWKQLIFIDLEGVQISLRDAQCGTLDDDAGRAWRGARVELENFRYTSTRMPRGILEKHEKTARMHWLSGSWNEHRTGLGPNRRFARLRENVLRLLGKSPRSTTAVSSKFRSQPYTQLAKVMRERGDDDSARDIESERIKLAADDRANDFWGRLALLWWWFYGLFFRYGLSPLRALGTLLVFWLAGSMGIHILDDSGLLKTNVNMFARALRTEPAGEVIAEVPETTNTEQPLSCGATITPTLYAAELMTPVLNFGQAKRCDIGSVAGSESSRDTLRLGRLHLRVFHWLCAPQLWEYVRASYILLGSVITSLALLTFSGIARRWEH